MNNLNTTLNPWIINIGLFSPEKNPKVAVQGGEPENMQNLIKFGGIL